MFISAYLEFRWCGILAGLNTFDPLCGIGNVCFCGGHLFVYFLLISQNRTGKQADRRADLDLQVSLLAEHEVTQLLIPFTAIAKKLDVEQHPELAQDIKPEKVMDTMDKHRQRKQ